MHLTYHPFLLHHTQLWLKLIIFILLHCSIVTAMPSRRPTPATDRLALLSFKGLISDDPLRALSSWNHNNQTLQFCRWQGVTCGAWRHPKRVTALKLSSLNLTGPISPFLANLTFLRRLNLSNNNFHGVIPQELGRLRRLQFLNLAFNNLEGDFPPSLTRCSNIRSIYLRSNNLGGEIPTNLSQCLELRLLSFSTNQLVGTIPAELGSLPNLVGIDLGRNNLTGGIPPSLGNLSSLNNLFLLGNNFGGQIPDSLGRLANLANLQIRENNLWGQIPNSLGRLASLATFDIAENNLSGKIPSSLFNTSSIYVFDVGSNHLSGSFPPDMSLPRLQYFHVYLNQFDGPIPISLFNASGLESVDLSDNQFSGRFPSNLGGLQRLSMLNLYGNGLEASESRDWDFLTSLTNCTNLETLDISDNKFGGVMPNSVANLSTQLKWLNMGGNQISGSIPTGIGRLINLTVIGLNQNLLTGTIPADIGKLRNLHFLYLFENRLSGLIPSSLGNLTQLNLLDLSMNLLQGSIPSSFSSLQSLGALDLSSNELYGAIPRGVVSLSSLTQYLYLSHNWLSGSLPLEVGNLVNIGIFGVSDNKLVGEIPASLGECKVLEHLYMEGNHFQGIIPPSLNNLKGLEELDLSRNNLSGPVPKFLESFQFLQNLNLSFNNLQGEVPTKGVFGNASIVSLIGNNELCGGNQELHLPACSLQDFRKKHKSSTPKVIVPILSTGLSLLVLFYFFFACYLKQKSRRKKSLSTPSLDNQFRRISYTELLKATDGFSSSNPIGVGSFSSVYKGILDLDLKIVAIKVLNLQKQGALRSFIAECEALRNIRHRNLVKIFTACSSVDHKGDDFKALVFEFMPNGSLDRWLHPQAGDQRNISFLQRMNIAVDVASALKYLHQHGHRPIVHCDLKPSNVLLDDDLVAHVGDFGLTRILYETTDKSSQDLTSSIGIRGSIGYVAPEYGVGSYTSTQGDIYSYGVLLLEMFTGKRPTDDICQDGLTLRRFVEMASPERVLGIVDPLLLLNEGGNTINLGERMRECLVSIMRIGLLCSNELPGERMEMRDVIKDMHAAREKFLRSEVNI